MWNNKNEGKLCAQTLLLIVGNKFGVFYVKLSSHYSAGYILHLCFLRNVFTMLVLIQQFLTSVCVLLVQVLLILIRMFASCHTRSNYVNATVLFPMQPSSYLRDQQRDLYEDSVPTGRVPERWDSISKTCAVLWSSYITPLNIFGTLQPNCAESCPGGPGALRGHPQGTAVAIAVTTPKPGQIWPDVTTGEALAP